MWLQRVRIGSKLIQAGHDVLALDIMWFGNQLDSNPKLSVIEADVRDVSISRCVALTPSCISHRLPTTPAATLILVDLGGGCLATMQLADKAARRAFAILFMHHQVASTD